MHVDYTASIISLFVCTYNVCAHVHIAIDPLPWGKILRAAFIVYWDELAEACGDISRVAGFRGVVRFQGNIMVIISISSSGQSEILINEQSKIHAGIVAVVNWTSRSLIIIHLLC